jgi:hypothetical protein
VNAGFVSAALGQFSQRFSKALNHAKSPRRWTSISPLNVNGIGTMVQEAEEMIGHDCDKSQTFPSATNQTCKMRPYPNKKMHFQYAALLFVVLLQFWFCCKHLEEIVQFAPVDWCAVVLTFLQPQQQLPDHFLRKLGQGRSARRWVDAARTGPPLDS